MLHVRALISGAAADTNTSAIAACLDVLVANSQLSEVLFSLSDEIQTFDTHAFASDVPGVGVWAAGRAVLYGCFPPCHRELADGRTG